MALNLNKGDSNSESNTPIPEKKGLNLSKSGDTPATKISLEKNPTQAENFIGTEKKKSSFAYIIVGALLLLAGIFWYSSKNNAPTETSQTENTPLVNENVDSVTPNSTSQETVSTSTEPQNNKSTATSSTSNADAQQYEPNSVETNKSNPSSEQVNKSNQQANPSIVTSSDDLVIEKAKQVINGNFGNGEDRKRALGSDYSVIQAKVNAIYRSGNQ